MWKKIWRKWKFIAEKIGNFQARVILSVFYFLIISFIGIFSRLFSDPLKLKRPGKADYWKKREPKTLDLEEARRQF